MLVNAPPSHGAVFTCRPIRSDWKTRLKQIRNERNRNYVFWGWLSCSCFRRCLFCWRLPILLTFIVNFKKVCILKILSILPCRFHKVDIFHLLCSVFHVSSSLSRWKRGEALKTVSWGYSLSSIIRNVGKSGVEIWVCCFLFQRKSWFPGIHQVSRKCRRLGDTWPLRHLRFRIS